MEFNPSKKEIILERQLNTLDRFVLDFCKLLDNYVVVSGYVSILFGRSRATEDVDLLIPKIKKSEFKELWNRISSSDFECLNTTDVNEAFRLLDEYAIRFSKKGNFVPNMEFKMIKNDIEEYSFSNKIKVIIGKENLFISPLEMQIAFKLFLAAEGTNKEIKIDKDVEDARYLYKLFLEKINKEELSNLLDKLNIKERIKWL